MRIGQKSTDVNMTEGSIAKHLIVFSIPLLLGTIFQVLYNTVDSIVVGNYIGKEALAAVGSMGPATAIFINLFNGFSIGASVIVSRFFGANDHAMVRKAADNIYFLTIVLSVFFTGAGLLLVEPILFIMNTPDDVYGLAKEYLTIYFAGLVWTLIYNMGSAILRAMGDSRRPLYFVMISSVIHIALDFVFVAKLGLGVAGAGYSTMISQAISALMVTVTLIRAKGSYRLDLRSIRFSMAMTKQILKIGLPTAIQTTVGTLSNILVQSYINAFGSACMASWSVYQQIDSYAVLTVTSLSSGLTTFTGQNLGAGHPDRVRKATRFAITLSFSISMASQLVLILFAPQFVQLFNNDATVVYYGTLLLRFVGPIQVLGTPATCWFATLRGAGITVMPSVISLVSNIALKLVYFIVATAFDASFLVLIAGFPLCWLACLVWGFFYYRFSNWEEKSRKIFRDKAKA